MAEHLYEAGMSLMRAFRSMMPSLPMNSTAAKELRRAQLEFLNATKSMIDRHIQFLESMEKKKQSGVQRIRVRKNQP
ncbi:MAG: hypothetical protein QXP70_05630 [Methanomassiliicoccales archaeon]